MKRCGQVAIVSGIPKNVRLRAAALMGRDSALATPNLKAAMTEGWGLDMFWNTLLICLVRWYNGFGWLTGGPSLRVCYRQKDGALSPANQPFIRLQKSARQLGRVDTINLTQWREGAKGAKMRFAALFPIFTPSFPRKRESRGLGTAFVLPSPPRFSNLYSREI